MRVNLTHVFTDEERNLLACVNDDRITKRQATRKEIVLFIEGQIDGGMMRLSDYYYAELMRQAEEADDTY